MYGLKDISTPEFSTMNFPTPIFQPQVWGWKVRSWNVLQPIQDPLQFHIWCYRFRILKRLRRACEKLTAEQSLGPVRKIQDLHWFFPYLPSFLKCYKSCKLIKRKQEMLDSCFCVKSKLQYFNSFKRLWHFAKSL